MYLLEWRYMWHSEQCCYIEKHCWWRCHFLCLESPELQLFSACSGKGLQHPQPSKCLWDRIMYLYSLFFWPLWSLIKNSIPYCWIAFSFCLCMGFVTLEMLTSWNNHIRAFLRHIEVIHWAWPPKWCIWPETRPNITWFISKFNRYNRSCDYEMKTKLMSICVCV